MGYPFDRRTNLTGVEVDTLGSFTDALPNASLGEVTVKFTNTIIKRTN